MDIMLQEFSGYELPDELEEKYRKLFSDMMKQVKYTVAEAKEVENKKFHGRCKSRAYVNL